MESPELLWQELSEMTKQKKRILIIEDDSTMRTALAMMLEAENCEVNETESGEKALSLMEKNGFDLIVTDLFLNGTTGLDIFKAFHKKVPVLIITGFSDADLAKKAQQIARDAYLEKPFTSEVFKEKVIALLSRDKGL